MHTKTSLNRLTLDGLRQLAGVSDDVATTKAQLIEQILSQQDSATTDEATEDEATEEDAPAGDAATDEATTDEATEDEATEDDATEDDATEDDAPADDAATDEATTDENVDAFDPTTVTAETVTADDLDAKSQRIETLLQEITGAVRSGIRIVKVAEQDVEVQQALLDRLASDVRISWVESGQHVG